MWRLHHAFTLLGAVSMVVGISAIGYAHLSAASDLQRAVDVTRRLLDDTVTGLDALQQTAQTTDAVRGPTMQFTFRSIATLDPVIAILEATDADMAYVAGTGPQKPGPVGRLARKLLPGGEGEEHDGGPIDRLEQARHIVADATEHARRVRAAALQMQGAMTRYDLPSFQPVIAKLRARTVEARAVVTDANPARGITVLIDLIAGTYIVLGLALVLLGRASARGRPSG